MTALLCLGRAFIVASSDSTPITAELTPITAELEPLPRVRGTTFENGPAVGASAVSGP
jgi:hypothetical protein